MAEGKDYKIIDVKEGNILDEFSTDKVILRGTYPYENSAFAENLEIQIIPEKGDVITKKIPYSGYFLKLFLEDFTLNGRDEIMVRGSFGGSGNFAIATIYEYIDNMLKEIFSQDMFDKKYKFKARYLDDYKVEITSDQLKRKYIIDISSKDKSVLDIIYNSDGTVKKGVVPYVSSINEAFPVNYVYRDNYNLLTQQRIIGVSNADTIGVMESFIDFKDGDFKNFYSRATIMGQKYDNKMRMSVNYK